MQSEQPNRRFGIIASASQFPLVAVGDLCHQVTSGSTPLRSNPDYYEGGKIPWFKTGELHDGFVEDSVEHITERALVETSVKLFPANTVLMAMYGDGHTITTLGMLRTASTTNQACAAMLVDESKCNPRYLFYALMATRKELLGLANGGAQRNLSCRVIKEFPVPAPQLAIQNRIAEILGSLDDKIELNRRMNETLEAMARAIFRSWFVDFDPVRIKARGGDPTAELGLSPEIAALFPDSFQDSELGEIPEGWKASTVGEEFKLTMGQSPPGESYNSSGEGIPFYQGKTDYGWRFPERRLSCTSPTRFAEEGDTLVSVRAPVGALNVANERCCIGRGLAAVRHLTGSLSLTYYAMGELSENFKVFEESGTVFGSITKQGFVGLPFVAPPLEIANAFDQLVGALDLQIAANERESKSLAETRDYLLPRLLSGELELNLEVGSS